MSLKQIVIVVVVIHAVVIFWAVRSLSLLSFKQKPKLCVQTVQLNGPPAKSKEENFSKIESKKPAERPMDAPSKIIAEQKIKETKKNKPEQKVVKKSQVKPKQAIEAPKKEKRVVNQEMLAKAQENIAKITKTSDKISQKENVKLPKTLKKNDTRILEKDEGCSSGERGYKDELANRLKLLLRLPEYGKVNLKLTLNRRGEVKNIVIESFESELNMNYVESQLPKLNFPPFGQNFSHANEYSFLISLNNED